LRLDNARSGELPHKRRSPLWVITWFFFEMRDDDRCRKASLVPTPSPVPRNTQVTRLRAIRLSHDASTFGRLGPPPPPPPFVICATCGFIMVDLCCSVPWITFASCPCQSSLGPIRCFPVVPPVFPPPFPFVKANPPLRACIVWVFFFLQSCAFLVPAGLYVYQSFPRSSTGIPNARTLRSGCTPLD